MANLGKCAFAGAMALIVAQFAVSCGSDDPNCDGSSCGSTTSSGSAGGTPKAQFLARCIADSDCDVGMICPKGGDYAGLCTATCDNGAICQAIGGDNAHCTLSNFCGKYCSQASDCPTGYCVPTVPGSSVHQCAGSPG